MTSRRALALSACAFLACGCGGKSGARPPERVVARQTATGPHASATASVDAGHNTSFSVQVTATPNQHVSGGWVVSCHVGTMSSRDAQDFRGRTPLTTPARSLTGEEGCLVVATASLARSGRLTVKLLGGQ
jgi:hypothetical protein